MTNRRNFILGSAALLLPMPAMARTRFRRLFDGRTMNGWTAVGEANWRVEQGALTADDGDMGFLVSRESFRDFELRAEFLVSDDANSGIFIRCRNRTNITPATSYEVNIFDMRPDPRYATGAIVNVAPVAPVRTVGGRRSVMVIRAIGDRFDVRVNGLATVAGARDASHREGPVALQYAAGAVRFRQVEVRTF